MALIDLQKEKHRLRELKKPLAQGFGGGDNGGMDTDGRVSVLENEIKHIDRRFDRMEATLDRIDGHMGRIEERIQHMPTVNGLWGMIATVLAVALAIAGLTFVIADYASKAPPPPVSATEAP